MMRDDDLLTPKMSAACNTRAHVNPSQNLRLSALSAATERLVTA